MNSVPPKIDPPVIDSTGPRLAAILLSGAALLAGVTLFFFNPSTSRFYPVCHFHQLTGLNCPGCGMTRALYAMLHGDFLTALHDNALFVALLFAAVLRGGRFAFNQIRGRRNGGFFPAKLLWPLLILMLLFTVLRNLPAFAFLSPVTS
jgi:hypothetical protein